MLGVAETISGVFCIAAATSISGQVGVGLIFDGSWRIYLTLNNMWANHQKAMVDLKKWDETVQKVAKLD